MEADSEVSFNLEAFPHVLDKILSYTYVNKADDAFNHRQVSKHWNEAATKKLQVDLELEEERDIKIVIRAISLIQNPDGNMPPLKKLYLGDRFFPKQAVSPEFQANLGSYLQLVSGQLELLSLEISGSSIIYNEEDYAGIQFTKLKTLHLYGQQMRGPNPEFGSGFFLQLCENILKKSSVLNELRLQFVAFFDDNNPLNSSHDLFTNFESKVLSSIPISIRDLDLIVFVLPEETLEDMAMGYQSPPNFRYSFHSHVPLPPLNLPTLPSLNDLRLYLRNVCTNPARGHTQFATLFPRVTRLFWYNPEIAFPDLMDTLFPSGFVASQVTNLRWDNLLNSESAQVRNLVQGFTQLKKLDLRSGDNDTKALQIVFQCCSVLEELTLHLFLYSLRVWNQEDLDPLLTGVPLDTLEELRETPNPNWSSTHLARLKTDPGLSNLKNLKILKLKRDSCGLRGCRITDATGHFGFLQMEKLERLETSRFQMSEECIAELELKFGRNLILES